MTRLRLLAPMVSVGLVVACASDHAELLPPIGQVVLYVDTDAPVPPGSGKSVRQNEPTPLFDTLRLEVFGPGESEPCAACTREFPVDAERFAAGAVSIGVPSKPGVGGYRVRASLFLQDWVFPCSLISAADKVGVAACAASDTARVLYPTSVISKTVALPAVPSEGLVEASLLLETESVGAPQGSPEAPLDVTPGRPDGSRVGSWEGAKRVGCASAPREGEACVPSGAFWMGNPRTALWGRVVVSPRLGVVSPFFMKTTEVTVAECRSVPACGASADSAARALGGGWCNYPTTPGSKEGAAVNCVLAGAREAYCKSWGGELPTTAQYEYVAGGLTGTTYLWGNDDPTCEDAMWGRADENTSLVPGACYPSSRGPFPPGTGKRDRLVLPTGTIVDVAGNLQEWTRDNPPDDCVCPWPVSVLRDPVCSSNPANRGAVLGSWTYGALAMAHGSNWCAPSNFIASMDGFRCVRPGL